jgi:predicted RNA-binding Zn ribbon-like protein
MVSSNWETDDVEQGMAAERAFDLTGGALCLDFANTLDDRPDPQPVENLASYADLLAFARQAGSLPETHLDALLAEAARSPASAEAALAAARELREVIYRIFVSLSEGHTVPAAALTELNRVLGEALANARVIDLQSGRPGRANGGDPSESTGENVPPDGGAPGSGASQSPGTFAWGWASEPPDLRAPLWPVARSAADLLTSSDLAALRLCAADTCAWLFLDTSRNGSRRWCSMRTCGNRAKARRHHARVRAAGAPTATA